jgi:glycosyltransferase involved in cell wall biosynthesis
MPQNPLISVIIPTRNRPALVLRAIETARRQTYRPIQIVVVVDGPDEASVKALQGVLDEHLKIVALQENVGGSEARNTGVRESSGDWIALLDDDDEWLPEKLEKQMALLQTLPNKHAFVACRFTERDAHQIRTYPLRLPESGESIDNYMCRPRGLRTGGELLQTSTLLVPRKLLLEVPFVRGLKRGQEFVWLVEANTRGGAAFYVVPEVLSFFNAEGFSDAFRVSKKPKWRSFYETLQSIKNLFDRRAYAYCIATRVLTDAIACDEPWSVKFNLLKDCIFNGGSSPHCVAIFLYIWMLPPATRRRLGEGLRFLKRSGSAQNHRIAEA